MDKRKKPKQPAPQPASQSFAQLAQTAYSPGAAQSAMYTPPAYATAMTSGMSFGHFAAAMQPYAGGGAPGPMGPGGAMPMGQPELQHANSQLATEMLSLMEAVGQGRPVDSWMPAQNLSLVGRMFDDMYTDSRLTDAARPMLGKLQFPVMKVALQDPTFFANPRHPVRTLVNDVFDTLTTDGVVTGADFHRLEDLLRELLARFEPDPVKLRQEPKDRIAVSETEAEQFLEQQKLRLDDQRKELHDKVRSIVKQELQLHIAGRTLPKAATKLLLSGFGPLLAIRYLYGGPTGPEWKVAVDLLDRVLGSLDPSAATPVERAELETAVHADLVAELMRFGLSSAKAELLGERLREAYEEWGPASAPATVEPAGTTTPVAAHAAAAVTVAAVHAEASHAAESTLNLLLRAGEWFRVWEASTKAPRWLKLVQYYAPHDRVVFEDFAGENRLQMKASVFGHDLAAERSVPVNPSPVTTDLIKRLPAAPETPVDQGAHWFKPGPPASGDRRADNEEQKLAS